MTRSDNHRVVNDVDISFVGRLQTIEYLSSDLSFDDYPLKITEYIASRPRSPTEDAYLRRTIGIRLLGIHLRWQQYDLRVTSLIERFGIDSQILLRDTVHR